ncbi:MAG: T9SS type A sorting domain-containing protein [Chitinophagaceae bacterium]|nr:T9SS type A sorting domain-containing protein [Chitinophagaceae bacterium]
MKNLYLLLVSICLYSFCAAQLTVTGFANNSTVCSGNSTLITASATPLSYTVTAIPNNLIADYGINILADAGAAVTPFTVGNLNDCRWDNIPIPFSFRYYGNPYTTVNISSNGWVGMGNTNSTTTGVGFVLPSATAPNNTIHGVTANLTLAAAGTLEYFTDGSAPNRIFVISYQSVPFFSGGGTTTFQIQLYETSNIIEIHTTSCTNTTLAKAQGVENAAGTVAAVVSGRNNTTNWTATGFTNGYRFTPDVINYTWSPAATLSASTGSSVTATPLVTTVYTIDAINTSNSATGSTTVTVTVNSGSFTLAGTPGGAPVCQNISVGSGATNYRDGNCNLIAQITPAGGNPVSNSINACTQVDAGASKRGTSDLYAARKYDIEPIINPATSTANVKLYFLQSEFDDFNARANDSGHKLLPLGPPDAVGISNLVLRQFHGTGTNPTNYSGFYVDFTTAAPGFTVVWNATQSWWEITVPVDGFSGFYLTSKRIPPLNIELNYFKGVQNGFTHLLNWQVNCTSDEAKFELQRSTDGIGFTSLTAITASRLRCADAFSFTDENPVPGKNYYRLKIIDVDGKINYSNIVILSQKNAHFNLVSLNPNLVSSQNAILKINTAEKETIVIAVSDFTGRVIQKQTISLQTGLNQIPVQTTSLNAGIYNVTVYSTNTKPISFKLIKQ